MCQGICLSKVNGQFCQKVRSIIGQSVVFLSMLITA